MSNGAELARKEYTVVNLLDYEEAYRTFRWEDVWKEITGFGDGTLNAAYEAIDRQCHTWRRQKTALIWEGEGGKKASFTFDDLRKRSNQVANVLRGLGIRKGDRVFVFLPRIPELYFSVLGIAKVGAIFGPLFAAFGPEGIRDRLRDSGAVAIITTPELKTRLDQVREELPDLRHVLVVGAAQVDREQGEVNLSEEMVHAPEEFAAEHMNREDPLYLLYTSGTTGKPKGVIHVHNDVVAHYITTKWVLDVRDDDIYWCTADPGWVTGTVYGIFGPWLNGVTQIAYEGRFDADKWYSLIETYGVTVWYTAPTALRMLMRAGEEAVRRHDLSSLRHIVSVGEPLNPEVIRWGMQVFHLPVHDNWFQTETGAHMITNFPCLPIKIGSMGKPFPGIEAAIIDGKGNLLPPGHSGYLALRPGWPSMLRGIWGNEEKFREYFRIPGWYVTGDTAYMDEDGYFWFVGRADDVINTSGHRVGPFEVESALLEHPAVAEAGVIGKPDVERGEIIKAFIVLREGYTPSEELKEEIKLFIKERLAAHAYPREIEFRDTLPKTRSGKIMRRVLKSWEMGLPVGDLSTLEE